MKKFIYICRNSLIMKNEDVNFLHRLYKFFERSQRTWNEHITDVLDPTKSMDEATLSQARKAGLENADFFIAIFTGERHTYLAEDMAIAQATNIPIYIINSSKEYLPDFARAVSEKLWFSCNNEEEIENICNQIRSLQMSTIEALNRQAGLPTREEEKDEIRQIAKKLEQQNIKKMLDLYLMTKETWIASDIDEAYRTKIVLWFSNQTLLPAFIYN